MNSSAMWVLITILMFSRVLPYIATLFRTLRTTIYEIKVSRRDIMPVLSELQQAAMDELAVLGFKPSIAFTLEEGSDKSAGIMLRHETLPVFAHINFIMNPLTAYPVVFYSLTEAGEVLLTTNRQPTILKFPGTKQADAFAGTLVLHWQCHKNRVEAAKSADVDDETAFNRIAKTYEEYFSYYKQRNYFVQRAGSWFMSFATALKSTSNLMSCRKNLRTPYLTVLVSDKYQSAYYAERYKSLEEMKKRFKYRVDVAAVSLILSLILSFALLSWLRGWQSAMMILVVLLVHEFGHAIAMYSFGYRDMKMFFVPFLGAFVSGNAKDISVWKQTLILLAGPVPGLLFGIWAIYYAHQNPGNPLLLHLSYIAIGINYFNFLPLSFLDGGKILDIAFFTRWPYAAFVFSLLSCFGMAAFMLWSNSYNLFIIVVLMALSLKSAWRTAYFRSKWKGQKGDSRELPKLFGSIRQKYGNIPFDSQSNIVTAVYVSPHILPPRVWETILALSVFILVWTPAGARCLAQMGGDAPSLEQGVGHSMALK